MPWKLNQDPEPDWMWEAHYEALYQKLSTRRRKRNSNRRAKPPPQVTAAALEGALARLKVVFETEVLSLRPNAKWWPYVERERLSNPDAALIHSEDGRQLWREWAMKRAAAIMNRARNGLLWSGGQITDNPDYRTAPFQYTGLVSDDHAILKLFVSKLPRGRDLLCGDQKDQAFPAPFKSKLLGCDSPYIEGLPTMRGFLRVEIDLPLTWAELEVACAAAGVPPPNIAVGWMDPEGKIRNPHLVWLLSDSVAFTPRGKPRFKSLFNRVLRGLTAALQPHGADAGGLSNCMRLKNPLSPMWKHHVFAEAPYNLQQLREYVAVDTPLSESVSKVPWDDHPDPMIVLGSNAFFRTLASWARQEIRVAQLDPAMTEAKWQDRVEQQALLLASQFDRCSQRHERDRDDKAEKKVVRLAERVAAWTWQRRFVARNRAPKLTAAEVTARQQEAGRRTANARGDHTLSAILAAAQCLKGEGHPITQGAVLARVRDTSAIRSLRTVQRHWVAVKASSGDCV